MSNQPRMFTAKRHMQTAAQTQRQEHHHHSRHHAKAQKSQTQTREIVEDIYGDLS